MRRILVRREPFFASNRRPATAAPTIAVGVEAATREKIANSKIDFRRVVGKSEIETITITATASGNPLLELSPIYATSGSGKRHNASGPTMATATGAPTRISV